MKKTDPHTQAELVNDIAVRIAVLMREHGLPLENALEQILAKQAEHTAFNVKILQAIAAGTLIVPDMATAH